MCAPCTIQMNKAPSLCTQTLVTVADHQGRPPVAVGDSGFSQEKRRELRSPASPCTAGRRLMRMAALERFRRGLAVVTGDHRLVLDGP